MEISFEKGFTKPGEGRYGGGFEMLPKNEMTPIEAQQIGLKIYLSKMFDRTTLPTDKIYRWTQELVQMNSFVTMNIEFLSSALMILDSIESEPSYTYPELTDYLKEVFQNSSFLKPYIQNLGEKTRRKDKKTTDLLIKKLLFSYIFKIASFRYYLRESIEQPKTYVERAPEIEFPSIASGTA